MHSAQLNHQPREKVRDFYSKLGGEAIVGLEATGYSRWFEQLLEELGHQVWIGDATEIRRLAKRRQKTDARDAALILDLLLREEFPRVHRTHERESGNLANVAVAAPAGQDADDGQKQLAGDCDRIGVATQSATAERQRKSPGASGCR